MDLCIVIFLILNFMLLNGIKETEFIKFLKRLQTIVLNMPWKNVHPNAYPIKDHLDYIFSTFIDIRIMKKKDIDELSVWFVTNKVHIRIQNLIITVMIYKLDNLNTNEHDILRYNVINDHMFNCIC